MQRACHLLAMIFLIGCSAPHNVMVNGQGSTFVEPVVKTWANEYCLRVPDLRINYQASGSGAGIAQLSHRTVEFGCTDAPLLRSQRDESEANGGPVVHIPLVIGAVVPVYHLPMIGEALTLSGDLLAKIFLGQVTRWNDPLIAVLNPGTDLPNLAIQPVFRVEPSGSSFLFSHYLAKMNGEFQRAVGVSTLPDWPEAVGVRQAKTIGVAGHIARTPGAIGYIELTYALDTHATYARVLNRAGHAVLADVNSITTAAAVSLSAPVRAEPFSLDPLTFDMTDAPDPAAYPIVGMSFAILYRTQQGPKGRGVVDFLTWATSDEGQAIARRRNYVPLPEALRPRVRAALLAIDVTP